MSRFARWIVAALLLLSSMVAPAAGAVLAGKRPNIIVLITDDQGYGDLSCHGNPVLKTPHLDRLHAEGVRFTDFHVSPTCAPTRSALLTGRHEFRNGVTHTIMERERLAPDAITLAQVLKDAGYTTGIFGKWHLGDEPDRWPSRRGFDEMFIHGAGGIGQSYEGSCGDAPGNTYFDPAILHNGSFVRTRGYCTDVFFGRAQEWMESVKGKQPFLAWIATNAPHGPLQVRPEDEARYTGKTRDAATAKFFGMIANIDDNAGRLLAKLADWGIERDTLVIFMNDNGGTVGTATFNAGMRAQKATPWLGGTRAASFWRWPGTLTPADCGALTAHIDVFSTLAELAGAKLTGAMKAQVEGRSLVPLLENPSAPWPERTLMTHVGRWPRGAGREDWKYKGCSVRTPQWHLVSAAGGREPRWQLFDVGKDYGEKADLAPQHPEIVRKMQSAYDDWWASVQPQMVNEDATPPKENAFKTRYREQFGAVSSKPNVLFLLADDMRADSIAAHGHASLRTPHLDGLVRRGFSMHNAYCFGGNSPAVCTPSRNMLLSGRAYFRWREFQAPGRGAPGTIAPADESTLPAVMRRAGYVTYHHGKKGNTAPLIQEQFEINKYLHNDDAERRSGEPGREIVDDAIAFLRQRQETRPFFLYLAFGNPHDPRIAAPKYLELFDPDKIVLPGNWRPQHPFDNGEMTVRDEKLLPWPRTEEALRRTHREYNATVTALDHHIGRLLDAMESRGLLDNTLVIFSADHGIALGSHGLLGKQNLYDAAMKVPLILAGPGVRRGRSEALVYLFDVLPTIAELAVIEPPAGIDGRSFRNVINGLEANVRREIFLSYMNVQRALRDERWKIIRYPQVNVTQLFDLQNNPDESHDLADDPNHAERVTRMLARLKEHQPQWGDSLPLTVANPRPAAWSPPMGNDKANGDVFRAQSMEGWTVHVSDALMATQPEPARTALELLRGQLAVIARVIPEGPMTELRKVPLWVTPPPPDGRKTAEYHPDARWLKAHDRDPAMARAIQFSNVAEFPQECRRMPMLALHELAHAYHHRVLGNDHAEIAAAYTAAVASKSYDAVQFYNGRIERAYAMTNAMEYFAESTEAFFGRNDFFPFTRQELKKHDPAMEALLAKVWQTAR